MSRPRWIAILVVALLAVPALSAGAEEASPAVVANGGVLEEMTCSPYGSFSGGEYQQCLGRLRGSDGVFGVYDVPVQILAPEGASGPVVVDLLNSAGGIDAPLGLGDLGGYLLPVDNLIFANGWSYATVRWDIALLGGPWPPANLSTPSTPPGPPSVGDQMDAAVLGFQAIADLAATLRDGSVAGIVGGDPLLYAYGFSQTGALLRGLSLAGTDADGSFCTLTAADVPPQCTQSYPGLFDLSVAGGAGVGAFVRIDDGTTAQPFPATFGVPPETSGAFFAVQTASEADPLFGAPLVRAETATYRSYELAGSPHISGIDPFLTDDPAQANAGLDVANPLFYEPYMRALFWAGHRWVADGVAPPTSAWHAEPGDFSVTVDENGNATAGSCSLGTPSAGCVNGPIREPELQLGRGTYAGFEPCYVFAPAFCPAGDPGYPPGFPGLILGFFRALAGSYEDLECSGAGGTNRYRNHGDYVRSYVAATQDLIGGGYLLEADTSVLTSAAAESGVGGPGRCPA